MSTAPPLLVRPARPRPAPARWEDGARRVLDGAGGGFVRLLGGPGTGKTTLLVETVARRIAEDGVDPEQVLVLAASRRAAQRMRDMITARLAAWSAPRLDGAPPASARPESPLPNGALPEGARSEHALPRTVREPVVRTVHSYAFAVLRLQASLAGAPPPRLLSGPEQDAVVRELLAGELELDGGRRWPRRLRPALGLPGFAAELRDLLLRAAERGLGPEDLARLGRQHGREEWRAAGKFFETYEQVTILRGSVGSLAPQATAPALDAAELVAAALLAFDTDSEVLRRERTRVRHLFVDDAQHLDPLQAQLVGRLGAPAAEFVVAGDPDQAIFAFRGADLTLLRDADPDGEHTVVLAAGHRMAPAVHQAVSRLAARLPGTGPQRAMTPCNECTSRPPQAVMGVLEGTPLRAPEGRVTVRLLRSAAAEAAWVADELRRAHLLGGVPWSEMAVLVRSTVRSWPVLRRALLAAGVPLAVPRDELPLARQPSVWPLLALLRTAMEPDTLDEDTAVTLLGSPLGGADPLGLRRLRRGLRRLALAAGDERPSGELIVAALRDGDPVEGLEDHTAAPLRRLVSLIEVVRADAGRGIEEVLWRVWRASGLEERWSAWAARGGSAGMQADRDLDAVVALFDAAGRYADRLPGAGIAGFADYLRGQQIPGDSLAPKAPVSDAVEVLTAHSAAGREWSVVAVPGVQEGTWPDLRLRGTLLGVERLVDTIAGVPTGHTSSTAPEARRSSTAPLLAEERRLLLVAASRARHTLLVSAVRDEEEQPSRFLDELDATASDEHVRVVTRPPRALVLAELVGELRRTVCTPDADSAAKARAARQLARLAEAGVPGAHPNEWAGLAPVSVDAPLRGDGRGDQRGDQRGGGRGDRCGGGRGDGPVPLSPSTVELIDNCPLRWLLERHGGQDAATLPSVTGMLVHALVHLAATGASEAGLDAALRQAWAVLDTGAPWFSRREHQRVRDMLTAFREWLSGSRAELEQLGVELDVDVLIPGTPAVRIRGRVDRLERDRHGHPVIVDVKTGKTPISREAALRHPQLAVYQVAASLGAFDALGVAPEPGGARLLYVSKAGAERVQPPLDAESRQEWLGTIRAAAQATIGPDYTARETADCARCPARTACPLTDSGRQVTS